MAAYWLWRGMDSDEQECQGLSPCSSNMVLRLYLSQRGIGLIEAQRIWYWQWRWPRHITPTQLQQLLQQWSQLLAAGLPLLLCLKLTHLERAPMRLKIELV